MLFVIAGIQLIPIFMLGPLEENVKLIAIGIYLFISAVFVGLAFWTRKSPYPALITATIFFVSLHVLFAILDPATIIQGLILKVVAIVLLVLGIRNAKEAKDLKEAFGK